MERTFRLMETVFYTKDATVKSTLVIVTVFEADVFFVHTPRIVTEMRGLLAIGWSPLIFDHSLDDVGIVLPSFVSQLNIALCLAGSVVGFDAVGWLYFSTLMSLDLESHVLQVLMR